MPRDTDWAYLAGIIDGEGTVAVYGRQARVVVTQNERDIPLWIVSRFGGRYRHGKGTQIQFPGRRFHRYTWGVYSRDATMYILTGALPYLVRKLDKATEVLLWLEQNPRLRRSA